MKPLSRSIAITTVTLSSLVAGFACGRQVSETESPVEKAPVEQTPVASASPAEVQAKVKEAFDDLEASGKLPKLDRSEELLGPDADKDGIRDDIAAYIKAEDLEPKLEVAVEQYARAQQLNMATDPKDPVAVRAATEALMSAIACSYKVDADSDLRSRVFGDVEKYSKNTRERSKHSAEMDRAFSGKSMVMPSNPVCEQ